MINSLLLDLRDQLYSLASPSTKRGDLPVMSRQNPPRRNVRTRSMWRSATSTDNSPLMGGIQRSRRVAGRSDLGATILQAHPTRARRPPPPPAQPRPAYQPLPRPSHLVRQAQIQAPSWLHQFLGGPLAVLFFQMAEINLFDYNTFRLVDRAMSQLLPPFSELRINPNMAARHLAVSCSNRRLINDALVTYSQSRQNGQNTQDAALELAITMPNEYINYTQPCTNTALTRPNLRYFACNGCQHPLLASKRHAHHTPSKIVCEECITHDFETTNPLTLCPERIIPMCLPHSEQTITNQSTLPWQECDCPNMLSPFSDEFSPAWFCSSCALTRCYLYIQCWPFRHNTRVNGRQPANHAIEPALQNWEIRRFANDLERPACPPRGRNVCYLCDLNANSWRHVMRTYPEVDVPGEMEGRKDFRWMVMLCMRCLGHVPDRDISRNRLGYQSSIPDNMA